MLVPHVSTSPAAVPVPANLWAQTSVAPGEEVAFAIDTARVVNVQVTVSQPEVSVPQSPLVDARNVAGAISEARPQLIDTTARILHRPPSSEIVPLLAPLPDDKLPPETERAKVSLPSAKSENSSATNSTPAPASSTTSPPPSERALAQAVQLEAGASLPPQRIKVSEAGQDNTKAGLPTLHEHNARSAASSAAQVPEQLLAESGTADKTPRPTAIETTLGSKDDLEKKAADSSPQFTLPTFAPAALTQEAATTAVIPAGAASAPPAHAPSSETRAVSTQQMLDSAPARANTPPAAHFPMEPGGEMQMRVGIRTTAFGAVEIYTHVHQNQVGLAVHGERGLAHWFSTEVPNIESGLKDHRFHLTALELDSGSTGLQTATSSDHRHPQRNFSIPNGWRYNVTLEEANETEPVETATTLPPWSGETRVSIHI